MAEPTERMNFDDLQLLACEACDGLEYEILVKVLEVLIPGIIVVAVDLPEDDDDLDAYDVTIPPA